MAFPVSAELSSAAAWRGRRGLRQFSLVGLKINALNWTVAQTKSSGRARLVGAHPSPARIEQNFAVILTKGKTSQFLP